jgi:hypothetical protein
VSAPWGLSGVSLQQQPMACHQSVHALVIDPAKPGCNALSVQQGTNPAVPVRRSFIDQSPYRFQQLSILGFHVSQPWLAALTQSLVKLRARDLQRLSHPPHGVSSSGNDGNREISFFVGKLHRLTQDLVFHGFLPQNTLEFANPLLQYANLGTGDDLIVRPHGFFPTFGHSPPPPKE